MSLGKYVVTLQISKDGYCGETYATAQDYLEINTYLPKQNVVKIKGGPELIMYVSSKSRLIFEAEDDITYKNIQYKWYCCKMREEEYFNKLYKMGMADGPGNTNKVYDVMYFVCYIKRNVS